MESREIHVYQLRVAAFENMSVDGNFLDEVGGVPYGLGILKELIHDCYELIEKIQSFCTDSCDD